MNEIDDVFEQRKKLHECATCGTKDFVRRYFWKRGGWAWICKRCAGNDWNNLEAGK